MAETMTALVVARFLVVVHNEKNPQEQEFDAYVDLMKQHVTTLRGQLVFTLGGAPSTVQRKRASEAVPDWEKARDRRTAVLTDSTLVLGVVTVFNWFFRNTFKAFRLSDTAAAAAYLGLNDAERAEITAGVNGALARLGSDRRMV